MLYNQLEVFCTCTPLTRSDCVYVRLINLEIVIYFRIDISLCIENYFISEDFTTEETRFSVFQITPSFICNSASYLNNGGTLPATVIFLIVSSLHRRCFSDLGNTDYFYVAIDCLVT